MTSHIGRLYATAAALLVLFLTWAVIAARPWSQPAITRATPQIAALHARELRIRREAVAVQAIVKQRWTVYQHRLAQRQAAIASQRASLASVQSAPAQAPSVRVVTLPPLTITRTS